MAESPFEMQQVQCAECGANAPATQVRATFDVLGGTTLRCPRCYRTFETKSKLQMLTPLAARAGEMQRAKDEETVSELTRKLNSPHVSELSDEFNSQLEMRQLVRFYLNQLSLAAAFKPGSKIVLEFLKGILNIHVQSTQYRSTAPDVEKMTDEQLEREIADRMRSMLEDKIEQYKKRDAAERKLLIQESRGCASDEEEVQAQELEEESCD